MLVDFADEWFTFLPAGSLELLRADLGLTYAQGGAIMVALSAGGMVGIAFEIAADHVSRRLLSSLGAVAYGAAMIAFGLGDSIWMLLAAAFAWGAASDAYVHVAQIALAELAGDDLPRILARVNAWAAVGDLLAPLTLIVAAGLGLSWRGLFIGGGLLVLAHAAWLGSHKFPPPGPADEREPLFQGLWSLIRDRRVMALAVVYGLYGLLDEPLLGFLIAHLERVRGFTTESATALAASAIVGSLGGFIAAARVVRTDHTRGVLTVTATIAACALPVLAFAPWAPAILLGGAAFGAAGAIFYTALKVVVLTLRPGQVGSTGAVISTIGLIGMGFPALAGWASDRWGLGAGLGLYVAVGAAVLALTVLARIGRKP